MCDKCVFTKQNRRAVQGSQRLKSARELAMISELNKHFAGVARNLGSSYREAGQFGIDEAIRNHNDAIEGILIESNMVTAAQLGNWQMMQLEGKSIKWLDFRVKIFEREIAMQLQDFIENSVRASVFIISQTSRKLAAGIVSRLIEDGESTSTIARELRREFNALTPFRSARIARTEVGVVGSKAQNQGAKNLDAQSKQWLALDDDRTRNAHNSVDGIAIGIDGFFRPDGESMLHPHDQSNGASAGNIINCRCDVLYSR